MSEFVSPEELEEAIRLLRKKIKSASAGGGVTDHGDLTGLGTGADHSYIDQDVTSGSSPTFAQNTTDNHVLTVDQTGGLTDDQIVRATASGLESRTDADILAQLSGDAGAAFDWNGQDLTGIGTLTASALSESNILEGQVFN